MVVRSLRRGEMENFSAVLPFCFARQLRRVPYLTAPRGAVNKSMHVAMRSSMMIEENKKLTALPIFDSLPPGQAYMWTRSEEHRSGNSLPEFGP